MQLSKELKTHKIIIGKEDPKEVFITAGEMVKLAQEINKKRDYYVIDGELIPRREIIKIIKISDIDRNNLSKKHETDPEGHRIIYYTDDIPTYNETKEGHKIYQFTQYKEVLRSINEGGNIKTVNKKYKGYYINGKKFTL